MLTSVACLGLAVQSMWLCFIVSLPPQHLDIHLIATRQACTVCTPACIVKPSAFRTDQVGSLKVSLACSD